MCQKYFNPSYMVYGTIKRRFELPLYVKIYMLPLTLLSSNTNWFGFLIHCQYLISVCWAVDNNVLGLRKYAWVYV